VTRGIAVQLPRGDNRAFSVDLTCCGSKSRAPAQFPHELAALRFANAALQHSIEMSYRLRGMRMPGLAAQR
jgi:hypothetical protein